MTDLVINRMRKIVRRTPWVVFCGAIIAGACSRDKVKNHIYLQAGLAGSSANTAVELLWYPIDTINMLSKSELPSDKKPTKRKFELIKYMNRIKTKKYMNIYHKISRNYQSIYYPLIKKLKKQVLDKNFFKTNVPRYYQGVEYIAFGYPWFFFIYYVIYTKATIWLKEKNVKSIGIATFLSAMASELIFVFLIYPLELLKTRFQVNSPENIKDIGLINLFRDSFKAKKPSIAYRGISPFVVTYVVYTALEFAIYKAVMDVLNRMKKSILTSSLLPKIIISSLVSAVISSIFTNPLEVWTVLCQAHEGTFKFTYVMSKWNLIWNGLKARIIYNSFMVVTLFVGLEYCYKFFGIHFSE